MLKGKILIKGDYNLTSSTIRKPIKKDLTIVKEVKLQRA